MLAFAGRKVNTGLTAVSEPFYWFVQMFYLIITLHDFPPCDCYLPGPFEPHHHAAPSRLRGSQNFRLTSVQNQTYCYLRRDDVDNQFITKRKSADALELSKAPCVYTHRREINGFSPQRTTTQGHFTLQKQLYYKHRLPNRTRLRSTCIENPSDIRKPSPGRARSMDKCE